MALAGILLLSGLHSAQAQQRPTDEQSFEIVNVDYDYKYRPGNEHVEPDIIGTLVLSVKIKGIDYLYPEKSGCHFETPEEAPMWTWGVVYCEPGQEFVNLTFPIMPWGAWARCRYYSYPKAEFVYSPYVWTTDYIDPETLDLVKGSVESISGNDNKATITVNGKDLLITGLDRDATLHIYTIHGLSVLNAPLHTAEGPIDVSLEDLSSGIYVARIIGDGCSTTSKIVVK